jgi:hypothetical protein
MNKRGAGDVLLLFLQMWSNSSIYNLLKMREVTIFRAHLDNIYTNNHLVSTWYGLAPAYYSLIALSVFD